MNKWKIYLSILLVGTAAFGQAHADTKTLRAAKTRATRASAHREQGVNSDHSTAIGATLEQQGQLAVISKDPKVREDHVEALKNVDWNQHTENLYKGLTSSASAVRDAAKDGWETAKKTANTAMEVGSGVAQASKHLADMGANQAGVQEQWNNIKNNASWARDKVSSTASDLGLGTAASAVGTAASTIGSGVVSAGTWLGDNATYLGSAAHVAAMQGAVKAGLLSPETADRALGANAEFLNKWDGTSAWNAIHANASAAWEGAGNTWEGAKQVPGAVKAEAIRTGHALYDAGTATYNAGVAVKDGAVAAGTAVYNAGATVVDTTSSVLSATKEGFTTYVSSPVGAAYAWVTSWFDASEDAEDEQIEAQDEMEAGNSTLVEGENPHAGMAAERFLGSKTHGALGGRLRPASMFPGPGVTQTDTYSDLEEQVEAASALHNKVHR